MVFTGIVEHTATVENIVEDKNLNSVSIKLNKEMLLGLKIGSSISIDGVCLTTTKISEDYAVTDVMMETLRCTTLDTLQKGDKVNFERAAKFGDEIGGHLLSGHVDCTAKISKIETPDNNCIVTIKFPEQFSNFIITKGYIAIDGISLTVGEVNLEERTFTVYLIPETIRATTLLSKTEGDSVNIEIDQVTKSIITQLNSQSTKGDNVE